MVYFLLSYWHWGQMIYAELQQIQGENILVITAIAPKDPNQETPAEVPKYIVYIDKSWTNNDYITPAITDITTRTFTEDQIKLISEIPEASEHLEVEKSKKIEAAHAATQPHQTLILVTAEPDEKDNSLTVLNTKTGESFKVSNQIELTDALCDFIKSLKVKMMTNIKVRIEFEGDVEQIKVASYVPQFEIKQNVLNFELTDLASDSIQKVSVTVPKPQTPIQFTYSYEDLTLSRKVSGGSSLFP